MEENPKAPILTILGDNPVEVKVGSTYEDAGATNMYGQVGNVDHLVVASNNVDVTTVGSYEVVYKVTDADGHSSEAKRVVNVIEL